jgi:hypothetical protein
MTKHFLALFHTCIARATLLVELQCFINISSCIGMLLHFNSSFLSSAHPSASTTGSTLNTCAHASVKHILAPSAKNCNHALHIANAKSVKHQNLDKNVTTFNESIKISQRTKQIELTHHASNTCSRSLHCSPTDRSTTAPPNIAAGYTMSGMKGD